MPDKFRYDTQDLATQIDVIRAHLRHLYSMNGPPPADLAANHDMLWPERESERLDKLAVASAATAVAARQTEQRFKELEGDKSTRYRTALNAAVAAEAAAKQDRDNANKAAEKLANLDPDDSHVWPQTDTEKATVQQAVNNDRAEAAAKQAGFQERPAPANRLS